MRLSRVFLLTKADLEGASVKCLEPHLRFLRELRNSEQSSHVRVQYKIVDDIDAAKMRIGHFACIRRVPAAAPRFSPSQRDAGCLIVEPVYHGRTISHLRLLFSRGSSSEDDAVVKFYLDRFFQVAEDPLSILLDELAFPNPSDVSRAGADLP